MKVTIGYMFLSLALGFNAFAQTPVDSIHQASGDNSALMRALDILMAREEIKADGKMLPFRLGTYAAGSTSATDQKVMLLTDPAHLDRCQKVYSANAETANPHVIHFEYGGANCPLLVTADIRINRKTEMDLDADFTIKAQLISPDLRAQFNLEEVTIPGKVSLHAASTKDGFTTSTAIQVPGILKSRTLGEIKYAFTGSMDVNWNSQGLKLKSDVVESYKTPSFAREFRQVNEGDMTNAVESYFVDSKPVSKKDFTTEHANVHMPIFETAHDPLHPPTTCQVRSYDLKSVSLADLRAAIKNGTAESFTPTGAVPVDLKQTGSTQFAFANGAWSMDVNATLDVVRLTFSDSASSTELGTVTGLLAEPFDLAKTVGDRNIRLSCTPQP